MGDPVMIWNCPHCSTPVSLKMNLHELKNVVVKCAVCNGMIQLSRIQSAATPLHELPSRLSEEAKKVTDAAEIAKETQEHEADLIAKSTQEAEALLRTDPAIANAHISSDLSEVHTIGPEIHSSAPAFLTENPVLKSPTLFEETLGTSITPPSIRIVGVSNLVEEEPAPVSFPQLPKMPPIPDSLLNIPRAPDFLTREDQIVDSAMEGVSEKIESDRKRKAFSSNLPVIVAAMVAIASGIYLFMQGREIIEESRRPSAAKVTAPPAASAPSADIVSTGADASIHIPPPHLRVRVSVPRAILREGPNTESRQVGQALTNEDLEVLEWNGKWFRVSRSQEGQAAWIRHDLVSSN